MNSKNSIGSPTEAMFVEAADWVTRAESGRFGREDFSGLEDWLSSDPRHLQAFKRMQDLLDRTEGMPLPMKPSPRAAVRHFGRRLVVWMPAAAAIALAAFLVTIALPVTKLTVETQPGVVRTVSLGDGSTLTVRGNSRLNIDYGLKRRVIEIERGEATFEVASHLYKPFVVQSNSIQVVAIGTIFDVAVVGDESTVTLIEGRVDVGSARDPIPDFRMSCRAVRLEAGQKVAYRDDGSRTDIEEADVAQVTAWHQGRIVLRRQPLVELVNELNRTFPGEVRIDDPVLGDMIINVSLKVDQWDTTRRRLEQQLPITFVGRPDGTTVVQPR